MTQRTTDPTNRGMVPEWCAGSKPEVREVDTADPPTPAKTGIKCPPNDHIDLQSGPGMTNFLHNHGPCYRKWLPRIVLC